MTPDARPQRAVEDPVFDAEITPHRSLGPRGFAILMAAFGTASLLLSIPFFLIGAWPVVGFFGLDVALLWLTFRISFAEGRACERIVLTYLELVIRRVTPKGVAQEWRFNPSWVRLESETDADFGMTRLAVRSRDASIDVARALSPHERAEFADAFGAALAAAKAGPRFADER
ncbi:DUF2244 domain-containing protein [Methylopila sp. Yamaguchi]|uniref:DUF2244 domain-containing protein n=1 Tax=Methylopila sp. Yamaguchi TaxID=1437817 RepID=UPI000CBFE5ED|nr:DUF2244 domain-containing protein [Methylopila sp. Yamaguchi]GBD48787.1 hypothetical protein METY_2000 [Methylopila sp. Yamaguchi]